ncbi:homocysteine biosynthesis protein [Caminicella sporogenes]|uniref:homocysteine biosynthesis protein n=1 Tax=Caminicella sporogenes TaxID=166485 RepID=UPI0025411A28|nr:homocysteine biosynthesis protein [Caminicella sporogenes]WIF95388.1 homocysteine biosynthesis protein [Caminicella sporogenes]
MSIKKSYEEINEKIKKGKAVIVTAEEVIDIVKEKGIKDATKYVDVVTTATFGPMCSTGAFLNFGHSDPPIRMSKVYLNDVPAYAGLAAVDVYIGATEESESKGKEYGGAHVICDLIDGKKIYLKATSKGTDCYPRKEIETYITKDSINEAYLFNPRNCYQNYNAAINTSDRRLYTYMGILKPNKGNITYSTTGQLSPMLNDPLYRTIGIGTRIFLAGAVGYVSWQGTQFNSGCVRDERDIPLGGAGTLAVIGNLKEMSTKYIKPVVFKRYGISMFVGIGIPIPILDEDMMKNVSIEDKDIYTNIIDYSVEKRNKPSLGRVSYAQLRSGKVNLNGKEIKTIPLSNLQKAREIANILKDWIEKGDFLLQEPIQKFPLNNKLNALEIKTVSTV